jgi:hypothetical protein
VVSEDRGEVDLRVRGVAVGVVENTAEVAAFVNAEGGFLRGEVEGHGDVW